LLKRSNILFAMINQILLNGIIAGCIYGLVALGFSIIYRTVKFFHFAHGATYTVGAYAAYTLVTLMGVNVVVSFFLPVLLPAFWD
jgi:branched-chain amino acid transport system permease protein